MLFPLRYFFDGQDIIKIVQKLDKHLKDNPVDNIDDVMVSIDIVEPKQANNIQKLIQFQD